MFAGFSFSDRLHGQPTVEYPASPPPALLLVAEGLRLSLLRKAEPQDLEGCPSPQPPPWSRRGQPCPSPGCGGRTTGLDHPQMNRLCHLLEAWPSLLPLHGRQLPAGGPRRNTANRSPSRRKSQNRKVRHLPHRIGHRSVPGRTRRNFYLRIRVRRRHARRKIQVPSSVYNSSRRITGAKSKGAKLSPCGADSSDSRS